MRGQPRVLLEGEILFLLVPLVTFNGVFHERVKLDGFFDDGLLGFLLLAQRLAFLPLGAGRLGEFSRRGSGFVISHVVSPSLCAAVTSVLASRRSGPDRRDSS